jgi:hypothetical protein
MRVSKPAFKFTLLRKIRLSLLPSLRQRHSDGNSELQNQMQFHFKPIAYNATSDSLQQRLFQQWIYLTQASHFRQSLHPGRIQILGRRVESFCSISSARRATSQLGKLQGDWVNTYRKIHYFFETFFIWSFSGVQMRAWAMHIFRTIKI